MTNRVYSHQSSYRSDIDGLRAIAVLSVIGFHVFPEWMKGGFIGVDIFFVISGFLISSIIITDIANNHFSVVDFYVRRINRIFPALLLVLTSCFIAGWFLLISDTYKELCKHIAAGATFLSNFLLWEESELNYFDVASELKPLLHLWSLGVEEQFYLCWPILLILSWRFKKYKGIISAISITTILSFIFCVGLSGTSEAFYSPIARFWELMIGSFLAYAAIAKSSLDNKYKNFKSIIGFLFLLAGFLFINKDRLFPGYWALLPALGAGLLISAGSTAWINKNVLSNKLLVWVGLISYPLYLWHWSLLSFMRIVEGQTLSLCLRVSLVVSPIFLAWLTYIAIERPIRTGARRKTKAAILFVLMIIVGCVGYYSYVSNWTDIRLPFELRAKQKEKDQLKEWLVFTRFKQCDIQNRRSGERDATCYESLHPSVALWGDSHAASLYPGLKTLQEKINFGIIQVTHSLCPPLFNLPKNDFSEHCNEMNEDDLKHLIKMKPDVIILHAAWSLEGYNLTNSELGVKLSGTIKAIKSSLPKAKIVVIGATPVWVTSPEQVAYFNWLKTRIEPWPIRQKAQTFNDIDDVLKSVTENQLVDFISVANILCDVNGCISRVEDSSDFIARDHSHFTKSGSEFFVENIKSYLFDTN